MKYEIEKLDAEDKTWVRALENRNNNSELIKKNDKYKKLGFYLAKYFNNSIICYIDDEHVTFYFGYEAYKQTEEFELDLPVNKIRMMVCEVFESEYGCMRNE